MIWYRIRKALDVSGRRRMREAVRQRAAALEAGNTAAADAVTASYVASEWARVTPRIVPASVTDYRIDGPPEAQQIARECRACETAPNGTGSLCACDFSCANYWLRANGYRDTGWLSGRGGDSAAIRKNS